MKAVLKKTFFAIMIFFLGFKVYASYEYKQSAVYQSLAPQYQSQIDNFYITTRPNKRYNRNKSSHDFMEFLENVKLFLAQYSDNPILRQKMVRIIGISNFKEGYIVNVHLLGQFLEYSKSLINNKFQINGFISSASYNKDEESIVKEHTGFTNYSDVRKWTVRKFNVPKFVSNPITNDNSSLERDSDNSSCRSNDLGDSIFINSDNYGNQDSGFSLDFQKFVLNSITNDDSSLERDFDNNFCRSDYFGDSISTASDNFDFDFCRYDSQNLFD